MVKKKALVSGGGKCLACGTRKSARRSFDICTPCLQFVHVAIQKALVDNYLQGQDGGSAAPTGQFIAARSEAIKQAKIKLGLAEADNAQSDNKVVKDINGHTLQVRDRVLVLARNLNVKGLIMKFDKGYAVVRLLVPLPETEYVGGEELQFVSRGDDNNG